MCGAAASTVAQAGGDHSLCVSNDSNRTIAAYFRTGSPNGVWVMHERPAQLAPSSSRCVRYGADRTAQVEIYASTGTKRYEICTFNLVPARSATVRVVTIGQLTVVEALQQVRPPLACSIR
jgi:hypothetical protein